MCLTPTVKNTTLVGETPCRHRKLTKTVTCLVYRYVRGQPRPIVRRNDLLSLPTEVRLRTCYDKNPRRAISCRQSKSLLRQPRSNRNPTNRSTLCTNRAIFVILLTPLSTRVSIRRTVTKFILLPGNRMFSCPLTTANVLLFSRNLPGQSCRTLYSSGPGSNMPRRKCPTVNR